MLFKKSLFLLIFCSVLCRALYLPEQIFIPRDRDVTSTNQLPEVVEGEAAPALKVDEMVAGNCHDGDPDSCFPAVAGLDEGVEVDRRARRNAADELPDHVVVGEELQTVGKMVEEAYNGNFVCLFVCLFACYVNLQCAACDFNFQSEKWKKLVATFHAYMCRIA